MGIGRVRMSLSLRFCLFFFFLNKYSSDCCKVLINFQSAKKVGFDDLCQCALCLVWRSSFTKALSQPYCKCFHPLIFELWCSPDRGKPSRDNPFKRSNFYWQKKKETIPGCFREEKKVWTNDPDSNPRCHLHWNASDPAFWARYVHEQVWSHKLQDLGHYRTMTEGSPENLHKE